MRTRKGWLLTTRLANIASHASNSRWQLQLKTHVEDGHECCCLRRTAHRDHRALAPVPHQNQQNRTPHAGKVGPEVVLSVANASTSLVKVHVLLII